MLAAEATPWLQPLSYYNLAAALGRVITLSFKAGRGRALDAQEAVLEHFGDGRPSNAD